MITKFYKTLQNVFVFLAGLCITVWLAWVWAYIANQSIKHNTTEPCVSVTTGIIDPNLTNVKPTDYRRFNSNWWSQRYIELTSTGREARMKELLSHYDKAPEYEVRKVVGRIHRVYPEVLICIAYADSSLGNFLKTKNNIGNVGNNDRWDRVSYVTIEQWVNEIGKTLNNRNLSYINTIDKLSRYWNKDGMIYASSPENHFINVANCISMIRNKKVPDNFSFRW